ncbi:MAG: GspH/FimT family pseudopilin [Cellvibrionaceae bacterium]|nr:GspH/FimT family pseudopilin [Cellvibrionaceae bacterium]
MEKYSQQFSRPAQVATKLNIPQQGLTLIELLVTVTILALLLMVGVPSLTGMVERGNVRAQVGKLKSALDMARSEALARHMQVVVCGSSDGDSCTGSANWDSGWLAYSDRNRNREADFGAGACGEAEDCALVSEQLAGNVITLRASASDIVFNRDGSTDQSYQLDICAKDVPPGEDLGRSMQLTVSVTGAVKIVRGVATCP